jgi:hypothetical protein
MLYVRAPRIALESLGEGSLGYEIVFGSLRERLPGSAIEREPATGYEQVNVRMPLERTGPGVQDCQRTDVSSEPVRIGTDVPLVDPHDRTATRHLVAPRPSTFTRRTRSNWCSFAAFVRGLVRDVLRASAIEHGAQPLLEPRRYRAGPDEYS